MLSENCFFPVSSEYPDGWNDSADGADEFRLFLPWVYYLCICNLHILYNDSIYPKSCEIQEIRQPDFVCCKGSEFYLINNVDFKITDSNYILILKNGEAYHKIMNMITGDCIYGIVILITVYMLLHSRKIKKDVKAIEPIGK